MEFESLYREKSAYVYALCFHLEPSVEQAERLFTEVWRTVKETPFSADEILDVALCRVTADCYLGMGGGVSRPEDWVGDPPSLLAFVAAEYRLPLVLKELGGLTYAGLGVALRVPESTIRSRLARARTSLRKRQVLSS